MLILVYKAGYIDFVIMLSFLWRVLLWRNTGFSPLTHLVNSKAKGVHKWLSRKTCYVMAHSLISLLYIFLWWMKAQDWPREEGLLCYCFLLLNLLHFDNWEKMLLLSHSLFIEIAWLLLVYRNNSLQKCSPMWTSWETIFKISLVVSGCNLLGRINQELV